MLTDISLKLKCLFLIVSMLQCLPSFAQTIDVQQQNERFEKDIDLIVEELQFMYDTDQALREYTLFKTYNKAITDSIENLPQEKMEEYIVLKNFISDSLAKRINKEYIFPIDELNTKRLMELIERYGFPSKDRIMKTYKKELDEEFDPYIILVHAPKKYREELKVIIKRELDNKRLNRCNYGHILWHLNGRKNLKDMLDNGYQLVPNENGQQVVTTVDCE